MCQRLKRGGIDEILIVRHIFESARLPRRLAYQKVKDASIVGGLRNVIDAPR